jgi:hypothetical protein
VLSEITLQRLNVIPGECVRFAEMLSSPLLAAQPITQSVVLHPK